MNAENVWKHTVTKTTEWTDNGNRYELNLVKVVLLLRT